MDCAGITSISRPAVIPGSNSVGEYLVILSERKTGAANATKDKRGERQ